jgi:hypothetical protein
MAATAALTLGGCAQTLTVKVSRYDVDGTTEARQKYEEARRASRPVARVRQEVKAAQAALGRYKGCLRSLNGLVQELFPGLPDRARAIAQKDDAIAAAFREPEAELAATLQQLSSLPGDTASPAIERAPVAWSELNDQLDHSHVVRDPAELRKVLGQLSQLPSAALVERARNFRNRLDELLADPTLSCIGPGPLRALAPATDASWSAGARSFAGSFVESFRKASALAAADLAAVRGGDRISRPYGLWQDVTDPYLMYVVAHAEHWRVLVESASVGGTGDVEYVLVFESPLDARLKTVTVDPSKVIQARLSIARRIAQAAVSASGIATTSFGVPLPTAAATGSTASGDQATHDTIDFSRMTADEQVLRDRTAAARRQLDELKRAAAKFGPIHDAESAQRALQFLKLELKTADAATLSM